jgi:hypothetical protein
MERTWQNDFDCFLNVVAQRIRAAETPDDLSAEFGGKEVRWSGILGKKRLVGEAPTVRVRCPKAGVDLGGSRIAEFAGLTMPVDDRSIADWNRLEVGINTTFTANLGSRMQIFPAVEVSQLPSGRVLLSINVSDAAPVLAGATRDQRSSGGERRGFGHHSFAISDVPFCRAGTSQAGRNLLQNR